MAFETAPHMALCQPFRIGPFPLLPLPLWQAIWGTLVAMCDSFEGQNCDNYLESWLARVRDIGRFHTVDGAIVTLEDITARDYIEIPVKPTRVGGQARPGIGHR